MTSWLRKLVRDEEGSAIVEFVVLALPLFLPLFIYLNQYATTSDAQGALRTLGREMARGFVTSENDVVATRVTYEIFSKGAEALGFSEELASGSLRYKLECKSSPCISPNNEIVITLISTKSRAFISTAEYVSPWA